MVVKAKEEGGMLAMAGWGKQACALGIQDEVKTHGHAFTLGVLSTVLNRLERRQLIRHRDGDPTPERGDRPKRFYALTGTGAKELQGALRVLDSLRSAAFAPQGA